MSKKKYQLKAKCGKHFERSNPLKDKEGRNLKPKLKTYKAGEVVESEKDLCSLFPNKFSLYVGAAPEKASSDVKGLGSNVTEEFPTASEQDLLVFKDGKKYKLVDDDEVVAEKLTSKKAVEEAIIAYVGE